MEADAKAGSSKGIAVASQNKDLESYHASASARDEAPAEARAANGRAATVGRDGTFQSDAAASLSEEVSHIGAACTLYQLRQEAMPPLCSTVFLGPSCGCNPDDSQAEKNQCWLMLQRP